MSERYERVYEGDKNLFIDGAPVLIRANALLKDTLTGNMIVQIKYQNVSSKKIAYLKAVIEGQNVLKETVPEEIFEYQNQSAGEYEIFGAKTPLVLKNDSIRSFSVRVIGVAFDDGTIWTCEKGEWKADPQFGLNVDREVAYRSAQKSMNEANTEAAFKAAAEMFHGLSGFKDADIFAEQCLNKAESARKDAIYNNALVFRAKDTIQALEQAISRFKEIPDYNDAEKQIALCEERITAIQDENERLRLQKKKEEEVARIEREKKQKKTKKALKIAIPSLIGVVAIVLLFLFLIIPSLTLGKAVSLMEEGNYIEAESILNKLDGFGSSENKITVLKAIDTLEEGDYDSAIKKVLSASETVVVRYNLCGGVYEQGDTFTYKNSSDYSALITPQKEGYRFIEWTLSSYCYSKKDSLQLFFDAVWSDEFSITYELDGGAATNPASYHKDGDAVILNNPVRVGYSFAGWTGTDLIEPTQTVSIPKGSYGDRTFRANWVPNVYTFTLDAAGGSVSKSSLSATYDSTYELPVPTRDHYTFAGWFEGRTRYENGTWKKGGDVSLTAKWTPIDYTITYDLNGGNNSSRNVGKYTVESPPFLFSDPTKTGYAFVGWYKDSSFVNQITGIEAGSHENVSIYAKWEIVNYTIAYEMSGGSVSTSMPTSFTIDDLPISLPSASKDGYVFLNWNKNTFDGEVIKKITEVGDITLFAGFMDPNLQLNLSYDKTEYSVKDYVGSASEVIIPAYFEGKPITSILSNAFYDCDSLVTVKIPSTVNYIGYSAFKDCDRLVNVNIPNGITNISSNTFSYCGSLKSIKLPSSLKSIGDSAFYSCGLESIDLPSSVTDIGNHAFSRCSKLASVNIPSGVKVISCGIFSYCTALTSVTIPNGVTKIEYVAFEDCSSLQSIVIPKSVTTISLPPFEGCKNLTIYCRASMIPNGWSSGWNSSRPVVWGYQS